MLVIGLTLFFAILPLGSVGFCLIHLFPEGTSRARAAVFGLVYTGSLGISIFVEKLLPFARTPQRDLSANLLMIIGGLFGMSLFAFGYVLRTVLREQYHPRVVPKALRYIQHRESYRPPITGIMGKPRRSPSMQVDEPHVGYQPASSLEYLGESVITADIPIIVTAVPPLATVPPSASLQKFRPARPSGRHAA